MLYILFQDSFTVYVELTSACDWKLTVITTRPPTPTVYFNMEKCNVERQWTQSDFGKLKRIDCMSLSFLSPDVF